MDTGTRPIPSDLPAPAASNISPDVVRSFRSQLKQGEDVIDPHTFAGTIPQDRGIAPRVRIGNSKWFNLLWLIPIGFVLLITAIAVAKGIRELPAVRDFMQQYPGTSELPRERPGRLPGLARLAALPQRVPADLHHPLRLADPHRPPAAVLDPAQHPGQGLVPGAAAGAG